VTGELGAQVRLAIPLAAQQLGFQMMGAVDAALLGHYNDAALASAGVGNTLLFALTSIGMGVVMGLDTVIPQAIGAGRLDEARRKLRAGIRLAILVGLALSIAVVLSPLLLAVADVPADVEAGAREYVAVRAFGVVPFLLSIAMRSYLAARNVTRPLVVAVIGANLANAALSWLLIFGRPEIGLPALGVPGSALGTVVVQLAIVAVYWAGVRGLDGDEPIARSTRADILEIAHYGGPVGGQMFAEVGIFGVATVIAAHFGKLPGAAHSIALQLASFTFSVAVGIGAATNVRVGHAVGAGDLALARRRGILGLGVGLGVMSCFAVAFVAIPAVIASIFTDDVDVVLATVPLLQIAALFQLSDGTQAIAAGALRGLGHTRATMVGNVIGHYVIGFPISLALGFSAGMGARGLWWGLSAGLTATAAFLVLRFLRATR
jgi:MATE family, multidrug efflux pump